MNTCLINKKIYPIWIVFGIINSYFLTNIYGQQDPQHTQYMYNTMNVNPAYVGSRNYAVITALGRAQWVGIKGAPNTQNLTYDTPLGGNLGLGINLMNDTIGPSHEIFLESNLSYTIKIAEQSNFVFGIRLGAKQLNIDWNKGTKNDIGDDFFANNINKILPTFGAGIYYYTKNWYFGFSSPNFLERENYDATKEQERITNIEQMHFFLISGYVFNFGESVKFKPAILAKGVSGAPISLNISGNIMFNNKFSTGLAWRWGDAISALLGLQVSRALFVGYAYDLTTSNYNVDNLGTHELVLKFKILKNNASYVSPRFF